MILEWNILHRVDSVICSPKYSNHLWSHSRAIMALNHSSLGLENKSGPIFCFRKVYCTKSCQQIWGSVNPSFLCFLYITSEVKQYYVSYRPRTECSISQFFKTNFTQSIFRKINRGLFAKPFKKFPKWPIQLAGSHFWQAPNLQWRLLRFSQTCEL